MNYTPKSLRKSIAIIVLILTACNSENPQATAPQMSSAIPTAVISPTPNLSATTPTSPYYLYDEFNDTDSGWSVFGDKRTAEVGYGEDAFRIAFYEGGGFQASWSPDQYDDFTVETRFRVPRGIGAGAGLTFRASPDNWYLLMIYPDTQEYSFSKVVSGSYHSFVDHEYSAAIQPEEENGFLCLRLKVNVYQDTFEILASDPRGDYSPIDVIRDMELERGHLGPAAAPPRGFFPGAR